jgi:hypothetical protein
MSASQSFCDQVSTSKSLCDVFTSPGAYAGNELWLFNKGQSVDVLRPHEVKYRYRLVSKAEVYLAKSLLHEGGVIIVDYGQGGQDRGRLTASRQGTDCVF